MKRNLGGSAPDFFKSGLHAVQIIKELELFEERAVELEVA